MDVDTDHLVDFLAGGSASALRDPTVRALLDGIAGRPGPDASGVHVALLRRRAERAGLPAGPSGAIAAWKIALSAGASRDSMGAGFRPFGGVLPDRVLDSGSTIALGTLGDCWIELELGLRLAAPLRGPAVTPEQARAAVGEVRACFEVLDRWLPPEARRDYLNVANGLNNWGVVVGDRLAGGAELDGRAITLRGDGRTVAGSIDAASIDDPYLSLSRLACALHPFGLGLEPGQVVVTGSLLDPLRVSGAGRWAGRIADQGGVSADFG